MPAISIIPADQMVGAFVDRDRQYCSVQRFPLQPNFLGDDPVAIDDNALAQPLKLHRIRMRLGRGRDIPLKGRSGDA